MFEGKVLFSLIATWITFLFGNIDISIEVLITFIILDCVIGVMYSVYKRNFNLDIMFKGSIKKAVIMIVLIVSVLLDKMLHDGNWAFRTMTAYFYIGHEGISIYKKAKLMGVPLMPKILQTLTTFKDKMRQEDK